MSGLVGTQADRDATAAHNAKFPDYDQNVRLLNQNISNWLGSYIIVDGKNVPTNVKFKYENCLKALRPDGLLVQQSESPLALMHLILDMRNAMRDAGFKDFRVLPFPQPCYPTGWWSCLIASKQSRDLASFRKADAAAKTFETNYYTADVHQGALAMPPIMSKALGG